MMHLPSKKRLWRKEQEIGLAMKAMKQREEQAFKDGVGIGAVVTLKVDYRVHCHALGLLGIVFDFLPDSGGVLVCCEHGIITHDGSKKPYYVPYDQYSLACHRDASCHYLQIFRQYALKW